MLLTFEDVQFAYVNKPKRSVLAPESDKVAMESYDKLMPRVSDPFKIITVHDNTLTILEDCIEIKIV